jgi:transposase-like protein
MSHPGPSAVEIELNDAERARLAGVSAGSSRVAVRARIVLACAEGGASNAQVARDLGLAVATVRRWRAAFAAGGLDTLLDAPRDGRPKAGLACPRLPAVAELATIGAGTGRRATSAASRPP